MKKLSKTIFAVIVISVIGFALAACGGGKPPVITAERDTVYLLAGTEIDLLGLVSATTSGGEKLTATVKDNGGFDINTAGVYTVQFEVADKGGTAAKSVKVEVISPEIQLAETAEAGKELVLRAPAVVSGASEVNYGISYKFDSSSYSALTLDAENTARLSVTDTGKYDIKFTFTLDGQVLETERAINAYGYTYKPGVTYAVLGEKYTITLPSFSDNVDTSNLKVEYKAEDSESYTAIEKVGGAYALTLNTAGYYNLRFTAQCAGKPFTLDKELYARRSDITMDFEGADGENFGLGDKQYSDNGGVSMMLVSSAWAKDGRYSVRHNSSNRWSGMEYQNAIEIQTSNTLVCYIYSESDYSDVEVCVFTDGTSYVMADKFKVKKGEHKYFIKFAKSFDKIKKFCVFAANSVFYIDALEFKTADVSNVLSLSSVEISASDLNSGDTLTLPTPDVLSTYYTADELKNGVMTLTAAAGTEAAVTVEKTGDEYKLVVKPATYTFTYTFAYDDVTATLKVTANVARFDISATLPSSATVGDTVELSGITGAPGDATVTVTVTTPSGDENTITGAAGVYSIEATEEGYYSVYIFAANASKNGEITYRFYAREYDTTMDFEGVGENLGYVESYEPQGLHGYTWLTGEWAADGENSLYVNMVTTKAWYGTKGMTIAAPEGMNAVTLTINATEAFTKSALIALRVKDADDKSVWLYSEAFKVKAGVNTYTLRLGANDKGIFTDLTTVDIKTINEFCFAVTDSTSGYVDDTNKKLYIDRVIAHKYSAFTVAFEKPELKLNNEATIAIPSVTSDHLSADEIAALAFKVEYVKGDNGTLTEIKPTGGVYKVKFTEEGIYRLVLTVSHRYHTESIEYLYALGTVEFKAEIPEVMETDEDYEIKFTEIISDGDTSGAQTTVSYKKVGDASFTNVPKKLGKYIFSVTESGDYIIRCTASVGTKTRTQDYERYIRQSGVYMDFEPDGHGGYVGTPYDNAMEFLPELSTEWSQSGDYSIKVQFLSDAWFGFNYRDDSFIIPVGTDEVSVWIKSDRTFKYTSFIAFSAFNSAKNSYAWYYSEHFTIHEGVNLYKVGITLYGELSKKVKFTSDMAGRMKDLTFHTELATEDSPDFESIVFIDTLRFNDTDNAKFTEMTMPSAQVNKEYTFNYTSPDGFSGENLSVEFRREGSAQWEEIYRSDSYNEEDITFTFDFTGKVDIRIIATSGRYQTSYIGTLDIK